jgi:hypothetical protein
MSVAAARTDASDCGGPFAVASDRTTCVTDIENGACASAVFNNPFAQKFVTDLVSFGA